MIYRVFKSTNAHGSWFLMKGAPPPLRGLSKWEKPMGAMGHFFFMRLRSPSLMGVKRKWQGYIYGKLQVLMVSSLEPSSLQQRGTFMWSIWHKVITVNE